MNVQYFATFRELTGERARRIDEPPATLGGLLQALSGRYGAAFRRAVFDGERLSAIVIILVNGRNVHFTGGLDTPLSPDDQVSIFPMVAGG